MLSTRESRDWKPRVSMGVGCSCRGGQGKEVWAAARRLLLRRGVLVGIGSDKEGSLSLRLRMWGPTAMWTAQSMAGQPGRWRRKYACLHGAQHAAHCVCDELSGCRQLVVLLAAHLNHVAPLALKKLQWRAAGQ